MKNLLSALFNRHRTADALPSDICAIDDENNIVFSLDEPPFHLVEPGEEAHFSGWVLNAGDRVVTGVGVDCEGSRLLSVPVEGVRELVGKVLPQVRNSATCGFDFDLRIAPQAEGYDFKLLFEDGTQADFFTYDLARVRREKSRLARMRDGLAELIMPDGRTVAMTQGHENVLAYMNSIIPFVWNVERYLAEAGGAIASIRSVLDIGCGSGRALTSWYLEDPSRRLCGCDINEELIGWSRGNLPSAIEFHHNALHPPLPISGNGFDMIQLISVFTHLSLSAQREWITEIARHLSPEGYLLITLHGRPYVRIFMPERLEEFDRTGYIDRPHQAEGANSYVAYHHHRFARTFFEEAGFVVAGYYPSGTVNGGRTIFPLAAQQDVYLLRHARA